jgi:hypothetical protein
LKRRIITTISLLTILGLLGLGLTRAHQASAANHGLTSQGQAASMTERVPARYELRAPGYQQIDSYVDQRLNDVMYRRSDGLRVTVSSAVVPAAFPARDQAAQHAPTVLVQGSRGYAVDTHGHAFNVVSWSPSLGVLVSVASDQATTSQLVQLAAQVAKS